MLKLTGITKQYDDHYIFKDFNLEVTAGEFIAITGPSGSGKSTLLNILGLIETINGGTYTFNQQTAPKPNTISAQNIIRNEISYLFQNFALIDSQTVTENLLLALNYVKIPKSQKLEKITATLHKVGLSSFEKRKVFTLSGGQQQRVAMARVMLKPSQLILADEPTGSLDDDNRDIILNLLTELNETGKTIIVVTHDQFVADQCHQIIRLTSGN